jgi:hypothetical protein
MRKEGRTGTAIHNQFVYFIMAPKEKKNQRSRFEKEKKGGGKARGKAVIN